jgi:hypothetical protein
MSSRREANLSGVSHCLDWRGLMASGHIVSQQWHSRRFWNWFPERYDLERDCTARKAKLCTDRNEGIERGDCHNNV